MIKYIMKRILFMIPTLLGVLILTVFVIRCLPGNPISLFLGEDATAEQIAAYTEAKGLNEPVVVQLGIAIKDFFQGDLGESIIQHRPVTEMIMEKFPSTVRLALAAICFSAFCGIIMGILSAIHKGSWIDKMVMGASTFFMSIPAFLWALVLMVVLGVWLNWIPVISLRGDGGLSGLIAPALSLGLSGAALIARTTRSSMLGVLNEDYIRTARAKGLHETTIVCKHALKAASMPIITLIGIYFADYLAGAVVIETIFSRPGIGRMLIDAIYSRDYAVVQGTVTFYAAIMILANLITDILYYFIDPRIRASKLGHAR